MDRRGFLSALGIGAIGLAKADLSLGGDSQAQQTTHTTTQEGTTTFGEDFTVTTNLDGVVSYGDLQIFEYRYEEALREANSTAPDAGDSLDDTAHILNLMTIAEPISAEVERDGQRIVFKVTRNSLDMDGDMDTNAEVAAFVAGTLAGAIAAELPVPSSVDVYLLMEYEDKPLDGDRQPQVYLNQRYRIKGEWAKAYVTGDLTADELLSRVIGTAHTRRTTTATTTTATTTTEDAWSWSYDVEGSDGTLELISGAMEGGHTLLGQYDGYASYLWGVVENVSGSTLRYAEVQANLYVNNTVQAQALDNMRNLPAGNRWRFEAMAPDSVAFDYAGLHLSGTIY